jgi:hypothetical protein
MQVTGPSSVTVWTRWYPQLIVQKRAMSARPFPAQHYTVKRRPPTGQSGVNARSGVYPVLLFLFGARIGREHENRSQRNDRSRGKGHEIIATHRRGGPFQVPTLVATEFRVRNKEPPCAESAAGVEPAGWPFLRWRPFNSAAG